MAALIEEEGLDEDGRPVKRQNLRRQQKRKRRQAKKIVPHEGEVIEVQEEDDEDGNFSNPTSSDESSSESESNGSDNISNDEVRSSICLPIPDSSTSARLLTCYRRKQFPVPSEPNQKHAHTRSTQLWLRQRLYPRHMPKRKYAGQRLKRLRMKIAPKMY
jgi:hypothetical protein